MFCHTLLSAFLYFGNPTPAEIAHDVWPQFRGGSLSAVRQHTTLPTTWSKKQNIAWATDIPGQGWSSPIVWKNRVFITAVLGDNPEPKDQAKKGLYFGGERAKPPTNEHRWMAYALDAGSGKVLWERELHKGVPSTGKHIKNTYCSETPATDGERLYVYLGEAGVFCLSLDGKPVWSQEWKAQKTKLSWGFGASPLLYKGRLFIVNDNEQDSFMVCLDAKTGKELWREKRDEKTNWSTPMIWENSQRVELITTGTKKVRSYDLDGHLLWELSRMSQITVMSPIADGDLLYVGSGYLMDKVRPIYAVKPGAKGDITLEKDQDSNQFIVWVNRTAGTYQPTPIVVDGLCYVLVDTGFLTCYDAKTGKQVYDKQRFSNTGAAAFTASPWSCDGKVFCLSEDGDTFVVEAGPNFKVIAKNSLDEMTLASPAVTRDRLFLRTAGKVYCIMKIE